MMVTLQYGVLWDSYIKPANLFDRDNRWNTGCGVQATPGQTS